VQGGPARRSSGGRHRLASRRNGLAGALLELGPKYRVKPVPDFFAEVKALLGEAAVA